MSLTDEERNMILEDIVDNLYWEFILTGMTKSQLLEKISQLLSEKGVSDDWK